MLQWSRGSVVSQDSQGRRLESIGHRMDTGRLLHGMYTETHEDNLQLYSRTVLKNLYSHLKNKQTKPLLKSS